MVSITNIVPFSRWVDRVEQLSPRAATGVTTGTAGTAGTTEFSTIGSVTFAHKHGHTNSQKGIKWKYHFWTYFGIAW